MNSPVSAEATMTLRDLGVVLNDVNKIRLAVGIGEGKLPELPKGIKGDPQQCVLARALSNGWDVEVDNVISLRHGKTFEKPFDWTKTNKTLNDLGFKSNLYYDGEEYDDYLNMYGEDDEAMYDDLYEIAIPLTPEMSTLISEFDEGLIPQLVLED